jgi:hypothetical protein
MSRKRKGPDCNYNKRNVSFAFFSRVYFAVFQIDELIVLVLITWWVSDDFLSEQFIPLSRRDQVTCSLFCYTPTCRVWFVIVLVHRNNNPQVEMSPHIITTPSKPFFAVLTQCNIHAVSKDCTSYLYSIYQLVTNTSTSSQQVVALTPNATFLAEKQEIKCVALEASMLTITIPMWFKYQ